MLNAKLKNKFRNDLKIGSFFKMHKMHKVSPNLQQASNIWFEWIDNCLNRQHVLSKNFLNETLLQYVLLIQKENNKVVPFLLYVGYFFITWSYIPSYNGWKTNTQNIWNNSYRKNPNCLQLKFEHEKEDCFSTKNLYLNHFLENWNVGL